MFQYSPEYGKAIHAQRLAEAERHRLAAYARRSRGEVGTCKGWVRRARSWFAESRRSTIATRHTGPARTVTSERNPSE